MFIALLLSNDHVPKGIEGLWLFSPYAALLLAHVCLRFFCHLNAIRRHLLQALFNEACKFMKTCPNNSLHCCILTRECLELHALGEYCNARLVRTLSCQIHVAVPHQPLCARFYHSCSL